MRKKLTLLMVLFISANLFAQVTNEGKPMSWKLNNIDKSINTIKLPSIDLKALQNEDLINDKLAMPWRFGHKFDLNYGFEDGQWTTLENGDRIWLINFSSKNALSLNVIFDQFFMPEGAKVYLYNNDRSDLLGAYTSTQNQESESLGTWLVQGSNLWIEYHEPANVLNQGKLHIGSITHAYRNAQTYNQAKGLNDSGDCNHDVDCPIGTDWENHKDNNKKSVALLISGGSSFCSGALVNNTANDQKGYFLTANHCYSSPTNWAFRFGWISPDPVCATTANSSDGPTNMTISGAAFRAKNENSDFALIEISSEIPEAWNRTWAGWDKSDNNPTFEVGIHHPSGDIMKICRDDTGAIQGFDAGAFTWQVTAAGGGWELGVTEPGSSGSPLFDQDGRLIGQLYGGAAACAGTNDNNAIDYYGRFGISWDAIAGDTNQLKPWLDPTNSGVDTIESYPPLQTFDLDAAISINIPEVACGITQVEPELIIRNAGTTTLTSATVVWNNGGSDNTINWTGSLAENTTEVIALGTMNVSGTLTISATISNPNNGTDENDTNDTATSITTIDSYNTAQVHLDLLTDDWAQETSWEFKDSSGTVLYSFGPYQAATDDNTHFLYDFDVNLDECYTFVINDTQEDGICCGFGVGSYELTDDNANVIFSGGSFGASEETEISISSAAASVNDYLTSNISIFPNPTTGILNVNLRNLTGEFTYTVKNVLGQTINKGNLLSNSNTLNINNFTAGIYFIKIIETSSKNYMVQKIVFTK